MSHTLYRSLLVLCLLSGIWLRFSGLTRGDSDFAAGGDVAYYQFHPDEAGLLRTALSPIDPLDPPFTAYGLLPVLTLRTALWARGLEGCDLSLATDRRSVSVTARAIAALLSSMVLVGTWVLGRHYFGHGSALLGLLFACFAPGAIQQGHFFLVDGFFTALGLAGMLSIARAIETGERRWYLIAGLMVGALGAVRFNGLALGLVLLAGHLARPGPAFSKRLQAADLWMAGVTALVTVLALQPYLLANPDVLQRGETAADFALSLRVASGELLQPWTLIDVHGTRYWDHWFGLWPAVVGWPLTLAMIGGAAYVAWRGTLPQRLVLVWCGLYFLSVGALPVKAVRYMVPILPLLGLSTGAMCWALWERWRWFGAILTGILVTHVVVSGLAFSRVYVEEDSRIQAGRWMSRHVPVGSRVGVETGAFSLRGVADSVGHDYRVLSIPGLFYGSEYMLCGQQVDYLGVRLEDMDWLALVTENRAVHFRSVPDLFPVVASFYTRLLEGELGFEPARRFVVEPQLFGLVFDQRKNEPSFLAYDHPEVQILRRREGNSLAEALAAWKSTVGKDLACPDGALRRTADALRRNAPEEAQMLSMELQTRYPRSALGPLLEAEARWRLGDEAGAEAAYGRFLPGHVRGRFAHVAGSPFAHHVPGDVAVACLDLGLEDLALRVLRRGLEEAAPVSVTASREMAESYVEAGRLLMVQGQLSLMEEVLGQSVEIHPLTVAHNVLAATAAARGDSHVAVTHWRASLALDGDQADTHAALGHVLLEQLAAPEEALWHLQRAVELGPEGAAALADQIMTARAQLAEKR